MSIHDIHRTDLEDTSEWRRRERNELINLAEKVHAARGPGLVYDTALGAFTLFTVGFGIWAYTVPGSQGWLLRSIVMVSAMLTGIIAVGRVIETGNARRAAEADRLAAHRHRLLIEAICETQASHPDNRQRDWSGFADLLRNGGAENVHPIAPPTQKPRRTNNGA